MSSVRKLYGNLNTIYNSLYRKYDLQNPFFCLNGNILTWTGYIHKENFYTYEEYYYWVIDKNQYSLAIGDTALIQVYFEEVDAIVIKGSMSFLPQPDSLMNYFRFDMDTINAVNFYHNSYHINFGYHSDDIRFTLHRFPFPSEFIKFALFLCGNSEFTSHSNKKFFDDLTSIGEEFSHKFDFVIT